MAYYGKTSNKDASPLQPTQPASLMNDSAGLVERLQGLISRISKIADVLYGSAPTPVGNEAKDSPMLSLQRNLKTAHQLINRVESELQRVEARL